MADILSAGVDQVVAEAMQKKPLLAICVGMQALMQRSEENGGIDCLGFYDGDVKFFGERLKSASGEKLKVPHMGWNQVHQENTHPLWNNIEQDARFYFVHSFYVHAKDPSLVAGSTDYGVNINAALSKDNVFAAQFHPEKSSTAGLQLLKNFSTWDGQS
ncbi:MAG: glutamine amidotransferase [Pseudohongiellaceae bacterium]|jgi:glutamine amidotransferase